MSDKEIHQVVYSVIYKYQNKILVSPRYTFCLIRWNLVLWGLPLLYPIHITLEGVKTPITFSKHAKTKPFSENSISFSRPPGKFTLKVGLQCQFHLIVISTLFSWPKHILSVPLKSLILSTCVVKYRTVMFAISVT